MNFEAYKGQRVLITGGLGFVGSNIAQKLARCGEKITIRASNECIGTLLLGYRGISSATNDRHA
jgi:NAD(P)-dependent dehydrogenase (short-subunit alcohol dehydrogenase family)